MISKLKMKQKQLVLLIQTLNFLSGVKPTQVPVFSKALQTKEVSFQDLKKNVIRLQ